MIIVNNKLIGDTVGDKENAISEDEFADEYRFLCSYDTEGYMQKLELSSIAKYLVFYDELLLVLCKQDDTILNTLFISKYDICKMTDNYEFSKGSYKLSKVIDEEEYSIELFIKSYNELYITCDDKSRLYLFGRQEARIHI